MLDWPVKFRSQLWRFSDKQPLQFNVAGNVHPLTISGPKHRNLAVRSPTKTQQLIVNDCDECGGHNGGNGEIMTPHGLAARTFFLTRINFVYLTTMDRQVPKYWSVRQVTKRRQVNLQRLTAFQQKTRTSTKLSIIFCQTFKDFSNFTNLLEQWCLCSFHIYIIICGYHPSCLYLPLGDPSASHRDRHDTAPQIRSLRSAKLVGGRVGWFAGRHKYLHSNWDSKS